MDWWEKGAKWSGDWRSFEIRVLRNVSKRKGGLKLQHEQGWLPGAQTIGFKWAFIRESIWAPSVPYMLCSLERVIFEPCWLPTVETVVYYKQADLSQRWRGSQSSKWQQKSPSPGCSCLWVRPEIAACGEGRSRESTCLLTVEQSVVLCSFMRSGTGCRNITPLSTADWEMVLGEERHKIWTP